MSSTDFVVLSLSVALAALGAFIAAFARLRWWGSLMGCTVMAVAVSLLMLALSGMGRTVDALWGPLPAPLLVVLWLGVAGAAGYCTWVVLCAPDTPTDTMEEDPR